MATNTYVALGQHKELSDIVKLISPEKTPFQSAIGEETVTNHIFNWTEEELAAAGANALVEGADAPAADDNLLVERLNYTQIFGKQVSLSGTYQATALAGKTQKMAHQTQLRAAEIKRDVEWAYLNGQAAVAGNASTARQTASFQAQVDAANVVDMAGVALTGGELDEVLASIYEAGGTPDMVLAHPQLRRSLSAVLEPTSLTRDIGTGSKVNTSVTVYISDVGEVMIGNDIHCKYNSGTGVGDIIVFDSSMVKESVLRPFAMEDLAKTGDADNKFLRVEKGLKVENQKAMGLISNVLKA